MFEYVREDLRRACDLNQSAYGFAPLLRELMNPGTQAILVYRFGHWCDRIRIQPIRYLLRLIHFLIQYFASWRVGIFIPVKAQIGPGFVIHAWGGGCSLPAAKIGRHFLIVGGGVQMDYSLPEIGDEVSIGPGTKVIGKVRLGNRVRTAPNSVIQTDVMDDCIVFGNPGRVIGPVPRLSRAQGAARVIPAGMARTDPKQEGDEASNPPVRDERPPE